MIPLKTIRGNNMGDRKGSKDLLSPRHDALTLDESQNSLLRSHTSRGSLGIAECANASERWQVLRRSTKEIIGLANSPIKANGSAKKNVSRSLAVPGTKPGNKNEDLTSSRRSLIGSRPGSAKSSPSKSSAIDLSKVQSLQVGSGKSTKEEKTKAVLIDDFYIRSVIPYLPQWLAVICLLMNIFIPGTGTMLSGFSIFCCGKPRVQSKEDHRFITLCVNMSVGAMQLFTVPFMLVGWFWSLVWGIYMLILAAEHKQGEKAHRQKELQAKALTALNANLRPWTLMRS